LVAGSQKAPYTGITHGDSPLLLVREKTVGGLTSRFEKAVVVIV
jgi:hypothetical protein